MPRGSLPLHPRFLLILCCAAWYVNAHTLQNGDAGIRIDLPLAGHVSIENQFGAVTTEVWDQRHVLVHATIPENASFRRSPVIIESKARGLLISVLRTPIDPQVEIALVVKIPASAHVEIATGGGAISVRGSAATMTAKSQSGDIRVELLSTDDLELSARTITGTISSEFGAPITDRGRVLRARLGSGERVFRVESESGAISLLAQKGSIPIATTPPALIKTERDSKTATGTAAGIPASTNQTEEVDEGDVIRVDSQLVTLNVSVIDRNTNRGVVGLGEADFRLFEDGVEQRILRFDSSSAPFDLLLVIDLSGSTREVVTLIRQAALRFVDAARPSDRIGIITFAGQPAVVSPVTLDREQLKRRIDRIETASGDTKLYDTTDFAMHRLQKGASSGRRTAIVLMSDGLDGTVPGVSGQEGSKLPYRELISRIQEFDGVLYTIWLNTYYEAMHPRDTQPEAFDMGQERMRELAEVGGGAFYEVERLDDLAGAYERVVADLGTVYSLAYRPSNKARDRKWRSIRVNLNRPAAVARGKRGYYAN